MVCRNDLGVIQGRLLPFVGSAATGPEVPRATDFTGVDVQAVGVDHPRLLELHPESTLGEVFAGVADFPPATAFVDVG